MFFNFIYPIKKRENSKAYLPSSFLKTCKACDNWLRTDCSEIKALAAISVIVIPCSLFNSNSSRWRGVNFCFAISSLWLNSSKDNLRSIAVSSPSPDSFSTTSSQKVDYLPAYETHSIIGSWPS